MCALERLAVGAEPSRAGGWGSRAFVLYAVLWVATLLCNIARRRAEVESFCCTRTVVLSRASRWALAWQALLFMSRQRPTPIVARVIEVPRFALNLLLSAELAQLLVVLDASFDGLDDACV